MERAARAYTTTSRRESTPFQRSPVTGKLDGVLQLKQKGFKPTELTDEKPVSRFERIRDDGLVARLHMLAAVP